MRRCAPVILLCVLAACRCGDARLSLRVTAPAGVEVRVLRVHTQDAEGLSGAASGDGELWLVAERQRRLLRMQVKADALTTKGAPVVLEGLAPDLETESLAWLGDGRVLIGTETRGDRAQDVLLLMTIDGDRASVLQRIIVDYARLGVVAEDNHGIEGACAVGDAWVLGLEQRDPQGIATVLLYDATEQTWQVRRLRLTTSDGKLASLDCRAGVADGEIEVVAIERHYGVGRLLAFTLGARSDKGSTIAPRVLIDLAQVVEPLPNFESVVIDGTDVIVITDNHHARVTGPTEALRLRGLRLRDQKR